MKYTYQWLRLAIILLIGVFGVVIGVDFLWMLKGALVLLIVFLIDWDRIIRKENKMLKKVEE